MQRNETSRQRRQGMRRPSQAGQWPGRAGRSLWLDSGPDWGVEGMFVMACAVMPQPPPDRKPRGLEFPAG